MPKRPAFPETNTFVISYIDSQGIDRYTQCVGPRLAVELFREYKKCYGAGVRMLKVVIDFGQTI